MSSLKRDLFKAIVLGIIVGIISLIVLYNFVTNFVIKQEIKKARLEADTIIYYRHYLASVAPKVKVVDSSLNPFILTPAYATNQVTKFMREQKGIYVRQVSDRPRNIKDKADSYEMKAIEYFKTHPNAKEFYEIHSSDPFLNKKHIFYTKPLIVEKSCLKCHGVPNRDVPPKLYKELVSIYGDRAFNYKVGEIRGVLAIVFPYQQVITQVNQVFGLLIILGGIFFLIGIFLFIKIKDKLYQDINRILEHFSKVKEGKFSTFKYRMNYEEFEEVKQVINTSILTIKKYQAKIYEKFYFHPLTHLPNRNKFLEIVKEKKYPITLFNADKFKEINLFFGVEIGDELIKEVAKRFKSYKKEFGYKIFHLDIDEFALLFSENIEEKVLLEKIDLILSVLEEPYLIEGHEILIRFRVGISFSKKDYIRADVALDYAKHSKKDIVFGREVRSQNDSYKEHLKWLKKLQIALKNDRIVPFFQPIMDREGNLAKYEALVRLIDEDGKVVSPFFFLDVAKKSRLYLEITKRVISKALYIAEKENVSVSVNLTLEDIEDENMREFIFKKLAMLKNPSKITFEIVETEDIRESEIVKKFLVTLQEMGSLIYIDDFGSGYSNFDYVVKLNPNGVKIDGSLIKNILTDKNSEIIVKTIISFAKEMNIQIVAEFVENEEIFEKLKELGVDYFQGYYFSPPKEIK